MTRWRGWPWAARRVRRGRAEAGRTAGEEHPDVLGVTGCGQARGQHAVTQTPWRRQSSNNTTPKTHEHSCIHHRTEANTQEARRLSRPQVPTQTHTQSLVHTHTCDPAMHL